MGVSFLTLALARKNRQNGSSSGQGSGAGTGTGTITDLSKKILLRSVTGAFVENTLTSIGMYALSYCQQLLSVAMGACTNIANGAFRNCQTMKTVSIPRADFIGAYSFSDCYDLTTATFLGGTIENSAFLNCYSLSSLTLTSDTVCTLESTSAFKNTPMATTAHTGSYGTIYVPASLVSTYKSSTNWSAYADRIEAIP